MGVTSILYSTGTWEYLPNFIPNSQHWKAILSYNGTNNTKQLQFKNYRKQKNYYLFGI